MIEHESALAKFKLKTFDPNEKVKDAKMQELASKMNIEDAGNYD